MATVLGIWADRDLVGQSASPSTGRSDREETAFGARLRQRRREAGLSQAALAERASLSPAAVAALEQGQRRRPHPHTVRRLADALGLSEDEQAALFQVDSPLAAPRASPAPAWTGPSPSTPLIGREGELAAVTDLLLSTPRARLVALTGPGGVGKTRLALAVAAEVRSQFAEGAVFVELAALRDQRQVAPTIARAFGIAATASDPRGDLIAGLRQARVLLILDNFEHLTSASALIAAVVDACPGVSLLVTSRSALRLRAEHRYPLEPLRVPAEAETSLPEIGTAPAVRLFADRARANSPGFVLDADNGAIVAQICRHLDGLPLAIELAAARVVELPPRALLTRLRDRRSVLDGGSADLPGRQQSLRATLDWSYALLPAAEQAVFRQLAIFAGGWTLSAAQAVCRVDGLPLSAETMIKLQGSLVDRSLARPVGQVADVPRFDMLATVRQHALEILCENGEEPAVRGRVAAYYLDLAETAECGLKGKDQARQLALLASDQDNLRAVLNWSLNAHAIDLGLRISSAMWPLWWVRGQLKEGRQWLDDLLAAHDGAPSSLGNYARALDAAACLALGMGDFALARTRYEQSLDVATQLADREQLAIGLHNLGHLAALEGDADRAVANVQASLTHARALGATDVVGVGLCTLGGAFRQLGQLARASDLLLQSLALLRQTGNRLREESALWQLAQVARDRGDWLTAETHYKAALQVSRTLGDGYPLGFAMGLEGLAEVALRHDRATEAASLLGAAARLREDIGSPAATVVRTLIEHVRDGARARLGDEPFRQAFQRGTALDGVRAVELALSTPWVEPQLADAANLPGVGDQVRRASLAPPPVRAHLVRRQRLLDRLDAVLQHGLTIVVASAGSGKTSVLVDWAAQVRSRAAVAWLTIDRGDDDPARFWPHMLAALEARRAGLAAPAPRMDRAGLQGFEVVLDEVLAEPGEIETDLVLILDDYHLIQSPQIHSGLSSLLSHAPPHFHLVLSSRLDPPLPLARRRAASDLLELRAADLRFSELEAAELLSVMIGHDLAPEQVRALGDGAEGWAVGLQLAALSVRGASEEPVSIARFHDGDRFVIDYFVEEVLAQLPDQTRQFLVGTSVLSRLCGPLCDAVLATSGSAAILQELERKSLFITPVDEGREWYRYHQLFAGVLRHLLRRDAPELEAEFHRRAVDWYLANGLTEDALEQSLSARDWPSATQLLLVLAPGLVKAGQEATVNRWLAALPDDVTRPHPVLSPLRALALIQLGHFTEAVKYMTAAEQILTELNQPEAVGAVLSLRGGAAMMREDASARVYAERALALLPPTMVAFRVTALNALARAHLNAGEPVAAAEILDLALPLMNHVSVPLATFQIHHQLGHLRLMEGRLRAAQAQFDTLQALAGERFVARQQALIGLAVVAYERNQLEDATHLLDRLGEARRDANRALDLPFLWLVRASLARSRGDPAAALEALERCEAAALRFDHIRLRRWARAGRVRLALDRHDLEAALRWAAELDRTAHDLEAYARETELLMLARVRLAVGQPEQALGPLAAALTRAEQTGRGASVIAVSVVLALARLSLGDVPEAVKRLECALDLAAPEGYVRTFVDEGAVLRPLLRTVAGAGNQYAARLLTALDGRSGGVPAAATVLLTPREREVLDLLAHGLSNRAIAAHLVTSEATIKWHVHHLIARFGVSTRAQVLVCARQQGLLN
jgi:LuxR family maltose regulon positive regulatory protein